MCVSCGDANDHVREGKRKTEGGRVSSVIDWGLMKPVDRDMGYVDPYVPKTFSHGPGSPRTEAMPSHLSSPFVKGKKEFLGVGFPKRLKKVVNPRFCSPFTHRLLSHLMDPLQNISLSSCLQPHQ